MDFHSPHDAPDAGIAVIYQEPTHVPDLGIAENVVMGYHPLGSLRRIDRGEMHRRVQALLERLGVRLDPERPRTARVGVMWAAEWPHVRECVLAAACVVGLLLRLDRSRKARIT